jgi:hypothetical protein
MVNFCLEITVFDADIQNGTVLRVYVNKLVFKLKNNKNTSPWASETAVIQLATYFGCGERQ